MQQCIVKYNKPYNAYDVLLSFQENFSDVQMFFDTGASKTIITLKEFLRHHEYIKHKDEIINQVNNTPLIEVGACKSLID